MTGKFPVVVSTVSVYSVKGVWYRTKDEADRAAEKIGLPIDMIRLVLLPIVDKDSRLGVWRP